MDCSGHWICCYINSREYRSINGIFELGPIIVSIFAPLIGGLSAAYIADGKYMTVPKTEDLQVNLDPY